MSGPPLGQHIPYSGVDRPGEVFVTAGSEFDTAFNSPLFPLVQASSATHTAAPVLAPYGSSIFEVLSLYLVSVECMKVCPVFFRVGSQLA